MYSSFFGEDIFRCQKYRQRDQQEVIAIMQARKLSEVSSFDQAPGNIMEGVKRLEMYFESRTCKTFNGLVMRNN